MSNFKTYFKNVFSACNNGLAYVRAITVLVKAAYNRVFGKGIYNISFIKIRRKWYCEVPGFPRALFEHTLMVGSAAKFLDHHARGAKRIAIKVQISEEGTGNNRLTKNTSTLTGGAFYNDHSGAVNEEIWLCPVTLFLLGRYPKNIQILEVKACMPSEEQVKRILYAAIEHCLNDTRQHFEETIVTEFKHAKSYLQRFSLAIDFAESVGFDWGDN